MRLVKRIIEKRKLSGKYMATLALAMVTVLVVSIVLIGSFILSQDPRYIIYYDYELLPEVEHSDYVQEGETVSFTFNAGSNVTSLDFNIEWNDDETTFSGDDEFRMRIIGPDNSSGEFHPADEQTNSNPFGINVRFCYCPDILEVKAGSKEEAREKSAEENTNTAALGTWTIEIECVSTGDGPAPGLDGGNDMTLAIHNQIFTIHEINEFDMSDDEGLVWEGTILCCTGCFVIIIVPAAIIIYLSIRRKKVDMVYLD